MIALFRGPRGSKAGVEILDDVALVGPTGQTISLEQDKLTAGDGNNLYDTGIALWNTLNIWAQATDKGEIDPAATELFLLSTSVIPAGLARTISDAKTEEAALAAVRMLRATSLPATTVPIADKLLALSDAVLVKVILKTTLVDRSDPTVAGGLAQLLDDAWEIGDMARSRAIADGTRGWFIEQTTTAIRAKKPAWIDRAAFFAQLLVQFDRVRSRRVIETVEKMLSRPEVESERARRFVRQLQIIEVGEDQILEAIESRLLSVAQRTRWAKEGRITNEDLRVFDRNLVSRWLNLHRRNAITCSESDPAGEVAAGKRVLYDTMDHREPLAGEQTFEFYTTRGRYHTLADSTDVRVGWHPRFEKLMGSGGEGGASAGAS